MPSGSSIFEEQRVGVAQVEQHDRVRHADFGYVDSRLGDDRRRVFIAESHLVDSEGEEIGRGTGTFMRSHIALSGLAGYRAPER